MSLLSVALLLLTTSLHTTVGDIICLPGKSQGAQVVHVGSNQAFGYKTQHGETYGRNTMCEVHFKKSSSCPSLVVSCPKFDIAHPKANCKGKGGDFLAIGKKRFCQNKGPTNFTSTTGKLTISFNANKKVEGKGAECTIACSDLEPTSSGTGCPESGSGSGTPLPPTRGNRTGLLESRYEYVLVANDGTRSSEHVTKISPSLNDLLLLFAKKYNVSAQAQAKSVTFCTKTGDFVNTTAIDSLTMDDVATCGVIKWKKDSSLECNDLPDICKSDLTEGSHWPLWDLTWCPETIGTETVPQCCFTKKAKTVEEKTELWTCLKSHMHLHGTKGNQLRGSNLLNEGYEAVEINEVNGENVLVKKISPTVDDLLLIVSQSFEDVLHVDEDDTAVTFCDNEHGTEPTKIEVADMTMDLIVNATCGFIMFNDNVTCTDLFQQCEVSSMGWSFATLASWNLLWCPGRVKKESNLGTYPMCCFSPNIRSTFKLGLWGCLMTYI